VREVNVYVCRRKVGSEKLLQRRELGVHEIGEGSVERGGRDGELLRGIFFDEEIEEGEEAESFRE